MWLSIKPLAPVPEAHLRAGALSALYTPFPQGLPKSLQIRHSVNAWQVDK